METEQKEEGIVRGDLCIPVHHDTETDFVDCFSPGGPEDDTIHVCFFYKHNAYKHTAAQIWFNIFGYL